MAGKATAKPKVKNGANGTDPKISMTYIDDILLRLDKAEAGVDKVKDNIDDVLDNLDDIDNRVRKVEARLGLG